MCGAAQQASLPATIAKCIRRDYFENRPKSALDCYLIFLGCFGFFVGFKKCTQILKERLLDTTSTPIHIPYKPPPPYPISWEIPCKNNGQ